MDIQDKKNKMIDILPFDKNKKSVVLNQKSAPKKEIIKPIVPLADIAANPLKKIAPFNGIKENIERTERVPIAEVKTTMAEVAQKTATIENVEEILKKPKKEQFLFQEKKSSRLKRYIIYFFLLLIGSGVFYITIAILPRAEIAIITKKSPWNFNDVIEASKDVGNIDLINKRIPAEIFQDIKNLTLSFEARGKKYVERKAIGEITIYNSYSSQSQILIKDTRFESPDGKIFYLDKKITVPGAKINEGKIMPSSIKATVTAERAGEEYNIGPVEKFTLTGFKNTSKYKGFYAVSGDSMKGGLVGNVFFPTEDDIKAAREKTAAQLLDSISTFLLAQIGKEFKIIEEGRLFTIVKENIDKEADKNGNFLVSMEGELKIIVFKESDIILELMSKLAKETFGQIFEIKTYNLNYKTAKYDSGSGKIALNIEFSGEFWQPINIEAFKNSVINKKESDLKVYVFSIPGVEKATISLWPRWVRKVPNLVDKIKVEIN
ncbi:MAG: hypothetical protein AAB405_02815 [Patescibacteria group bacterium]